MIKIKEEKFIHTGNLYEFQLENDDTLYLTYPTLEKIINNENTNATLYSVNEIAYNPVFNDKEFTDDDTEIIGFRIVTYKLIVKDHGNIIQEERFINFSNLKQWLVNNSYDLFNWIQENEPEMELPNFEYDESLQDLKTTLNGYNYNWWTVYIITD